MSSHHDIREGVYHYVEMYDAGGVYSRSTYPTAEEAKKTAARYHKNTQASRLAGTWPEGHGTRAVTETVTRKVL